MANVSGYDDSTPVEVHDVSPTTPSVLQAFVAGSTKVQLYWDKVGNNYWYDIYRSTTPNFSVTGLTPIYSEDAVHDSYLDTTASASTTYYYRVVARWSSGSGQIEAMPTAAVTANTSIIYEPSIDTFDENIPISTASSVDITSTGTFDVPIYNSDGALTSIAISLPNLTSSLSSETDYTFDVNTSTGNVEFEDLRGGTVVRIELIRTKAGVPYSHVFQLFDDMGEGSDYVFDKVPMPGTDEITLPVSSMYLVSTARGSYDTGFNETNWNYLWNQTHGIAFEMSSISDAVGSIEDWWNTDDNFTFPIDSLTFIDHGSEAFPGMGCGRNSNASDGTFLDLRHPDSYYAELAEELKKLRINNGLDTVTFFECDVATQYAAVAMSDLAEFTGVKIVAYTKKVYAGKDKNGAIHWLKASDCQKVTCETNGTTRHYDPA